MKRKPKPKVGDTITINTNGIDGYIEGIPMVFVDANGKSQQPHSFPAEVSKVKYGRRKNKGAVTLTLTPSRFFDRPLTPDECFNKKGQ